MCNLNNLKQFILILLLLNTSLIFSQGKSSTNDGCQKLIDNGVIEYKQGNYIKALEYLTKSEVLIDKEDYRKLFRVKNTIGICYGYLSNYGEALSIYMEAMEIAKKNNLIEDQINVMCNIGILYSLKNDYKNAIRLYEKAIKIAYSIDSDYSKTLLAVNIADVYNQLGDYKKAQFYLKSVENLKKTEFFEQIFKINYAESLLIEGKVSEAGKIMNKLVDNVKLDNLSCYICVAELMSKIYDTQNNNDMAILYANRGLMNATDMTDKLNLYNHLSSLYSKKREYHKALQYKDSVIQTKDSLGEKINRQLFAVNKVKLDIQAYQNELTLNKKSQQAQRKLFWVIIVALLVLFFFLYSWQKNRMAKHKQEKKLIENNQKIMTLELEKERQEHFFLKDQTKLKEERLKNKIAKKNRKLSSKALYLSDRNELIENIMVSLSRIPEISTNKKVIDDIKTLKRQLKTDQEWQKFVKNFEEINPNFFKVLKEEHTTLNTQDIRFLCYLYMSLDLKEISTVLGITLAASKKRKQRIAKKTGHNTEELREYILKIG